MQAYAGTYDLQLFYRPLAFCTPSASGNHFLNAHRVQSDAVFYENTDALLRPPAFRLTAYFRYIIMPGSRLLSHAVSSIVPSAARIFTVVFGMGTGVPSARIATRQNYQCFPTFRENTRCSALRAPASLRPFAFPQCFALLHAHVRTFVKASQMPMHAWHLLSFSSLFSLT